MESLESNGNSECSWLVVTWLLLNWLLLNWLLLKTSGEQTASDPSDIEIMMSGSSLMGGSSLVGHSVRGLSSAVARFWGGSSAVIRFWGAGGSGSSFPPSISAN